VTVPLAIDLFCGLGGWTDGLLAEGYYVVGFDNERHVYGDMKYPAQLVVQDVLTLHGRQFRDAALIVASPPCQFFSYTAMPWKLAKQRAEKTRNDPDLLAKELELFNACWRIQREASEAAGRHIPMVVENVKGAQPWVGKAIANYGSYYLWTSAPDFVYRGSIQHGGGELFGHRSSGAVKNPGFRFDGSGKSFQSESVKNAGQDWSRHKKTGEVSPHWNVSATKNSGGSWFRIAHNTTSGKARNPDGRNDLKSPKRKAASALIAKIPFELSRHIATVWKPEEARCG
jgi:hypothetical protein